MQKSFATQVTLIKIFNPYYMSSYNNNNVYAVFMILSHII